MVKPGLFAQDRRILIGIVNLDGFNCRNFPKIGSDPFTGIGVPEQLRFHDQATYSRRIDKTHRLVYRVDGKALVIISARFHYEK